MTEEQKKRLWQLVKPLLEILLAGVIYVIVIKIIGFGIPCPIKLVTGKYCPGCGITRMFLAMLRLDFEAAYYANRLLFFLFPVIMVYGLIKGIQYIRTGNETRSTIEQIGIFLVCIVTIAFWVMRNMEQFSWLAPMT